MACIDPETWQTREAEIRTIIRDRLRPLGTVLNVQDLLFDQHEAVGLPRSTNDRDFGTIPNARILAGELEYLVSSAIRSLENDGDLVATSGGGGHGARYIHEMARHLEWQGNHWGFEVPGSVTGTIRLHGRETGAWQETPTTRWQNVDRLTTQAWQAFADGLDVAGAVTARVAVEEAVRITLDQLDDPQPDLRAARRETHLFANHLRIAGNFAPLDRNATMAALTAIRDRGNQAAHDGVVDHELLQDALMRLLPQALTSLSNAVAAQVLGLNEDQASF